MIISWTLIIDHGDDGEWQRKGDNGDDVEWISITMSDEFDEDVVVNGVDGDGVDGDGVDVDGVDGVGVGMG